MLVLTIKASEHPINCVVEQGWLSCDKFYQ